MISGSAFRRKVDREKNVEAVEIGAASGCRAGEFRASGQAGARGEYFTEG
jgi:hypothetical protein